MGMCGIFFYFLISQQNSAELKPKLVFEAIDGMAKFIHFHPISNIMDHVWKILILRLSTYRKSGLELKMFCFLEFTS